jgi:hypothetical protein
VTPLDRSRHCSAVLFVLFCRNDCTGEPAPVCPFLRAIAACATTNELKRKTAIFG